MIGPKGGELAQLTEKMLLLKEMSTNFFPHFCSFRSIILVELNSAHGKED